MGISKIVFVNDVREKVVKPLVIENVRLQGKYGIDYYGKTGRQAILTQAIAKLDVPLQNFHRNHEKKKSRKACEEKLTKAIHFDLVAQSSFLEKYSDIEQLGRGLLNVLLNITTGILPGLAYYAFTGHSFLRVKGKTHCAAQESCDNARAILGTHLR